MDNTIKCEVTVTVVIYAESQADAMRIVSERLRAGMTLATDKTALSIVTASTKMAK